MSHYKALFRYNMLLGSMLSIVASGVLLDMLMLRMDFDLSHFGLLKGSMFFLPGISGWLLSGWLTNLNRDRQVIATAYGFRVLLPLTLPLAAMLGMRGDPLLWYCVLIFSLSYSLAGLANNSLQALYVQLLPPKTFFEQSNQLMQISCITSGTLGLLGAWILAHVTDSGPNTFFTVFLVLAVVTGITELPAARIILSLPAPPPLPPELRRSFSLRDALNLFLAPSYRMLLAYTLVFCLWYGGLIAYLNIYLLKILEVSPTALTLIESLLFIASYFSSKWLGRLGDSRGMRHSILTGSAVIAAAGLPCLFYDGTRHWCIWLLMGTCGAAGIMSKSLHSFLILSASHLAEPGKVITEAATFALVLSLSMFAGSLLGGWIFGLLQEHLTELQTFITYFRIFFLLSLPLLFIPWLAKGRRKRR